MDVTIDDENVAIAIGSLMLVNKTDRMSDLVLDYVRNCPVTRVDRKPLLVADTPNRRAAYIWTTAILPIVGLDKDAIRFVGPLTAC